MDVEKGTTAIASDVEYHAYGVGIAGDDIAKIVGVDRVGETTVANIDNFAIAEGGMDYAARGAERGAEVVCYQEVDVNATLREEAVVDGVVVGYVVGAVEVDMTVAEGAEHGGTEGEEAVGRHAIAYLGTKRVVDGVPIDVFDIKHGVLLVNNVPEIVESSGGSGLGLVHESLLAARE